MSQAPRVRVRSWVLGAAAVGLLLVVSAGPKASADPSKPYVEGEVLVGFKKNVGASARGASLGKAGARVLQHLATELDRELGEAGVHRVATDLSVEAAIDVLRRDPNVAYAEPNYIVRHSADSNDTHYLNGTLWGMYGSDSPTASGPSGTTNANGCNAEKAWADGNTGSTSVCVGVIDEGIQFTHPDLAANVWTNPFETPDNGVDDDGNGYIDDVHGWDFFHGDKTVYDAADGDEHGTHVSGTIGAVGGNAAGVAGVNWNVTLISAKFLGPNGGSTSGAVAALNYLRDLKTRHDINIVCTSNSWGGGGYTTALHTAILKAAKEGILFVAAAGNSNSNNDNVGSYPSNYTTLSPSSTETAADYEAVIAVAAIDSTGAKASFSSYGATTVDIGAPGVGVRSTLPGGYGDYSGTSMATPHVSGAAALYASVNTDATAEEIRNAILANATPTSSLAGKTVTGGRLNLGGTFFTGTPEPPPSGGSHDVAVTSVSLPGSVKRGKTVNVNISLANQGSYSETFTVSLSGSAGTFGAPKQITLATGATGSTSIAWTAPSTTGTRTVVASASVHPDEADTADNSRSATTTVR
jgi:subtilisin family serine protease